MAKVKLFTYERLLAILEELPTFEEQDWINTPKEYFLAYSSLMLLVKRLGKDALAKAVGSQNYWSWKNQYFVWRYGDNLLNSKLRKPAYQVETEWRMKYNVYKESMMNLWADSVLQSILKFFDKFYSLVDLFLGGFL